MDAKVADVLYRFHVDLGNLESVITDSQPRPFRLNGPDSFQRRAYPFCPPVTLLKEPEEAYLLGQGTVAGIGNRYHWRDWKHHVI